MCSLKGLNIPNKNLCLKKLGEMLSFRFFFHLGFMQPRVPLLWGLKKHHQGDMETTEVSYSSFDSNEARDCCKDER